MKLSSRAEASLPMTPGQEPGDGFDNHDGRRLPPGQHVVADRELPVDEMLRHPLVDPFVAAAQQREAARGLCRPEPASSSAMC